MLLDAFGWKFVQRHADHPFLRRLAIEPVASQFPSTTTAHLTTLYTGLPVEQHGLYEWQRLRPGAGHDHPAAAVRRPRTGRCSSTRARSCPARRCSSSSTCRRLVLQQSTIWPGKYGSAAFTGAHVEPFERFEDATAQLGGTGLTYIYWDAIDATGHRHGPSSAEFDAAALAALDALDRVRDTFILVTADHGQIDVGEHIDFLDELWPPLLEHLKQPAPAGSARDCFLHVREPETVVGELAERLGERAEVVLAADLFPAAGPRLTARLADVCVLPAPGRMAWLRSNPSHQLRFKGHHGGRTPEESETWVGIMQT